MRSSKARPPAGSVPQGVPDDFPILERDAVRVVIRDSVERILLFHTHEITAPELGRWWELPGGGIEPGETYRDAAVRELFEETGISVPTSQVGRPTWQRTATFRHRHLRHLQHEVVVEVRLNKPGTAIDETRRLDYETEDYFDFRWWPVDEVAMSTDQFYPRHLPQLLSRFLSGEQLAEPLEVWS